MTTDCDQPATWHDLPGVTADEIRAAAWHVLTDTTLTGVELVAVGEAYVALVAARVTALDGVAAWWPAVSVLGVEAGSDPTAVAWAVLLTVQAAIDCPTEADVTACLVSVVGETRAGALTPA